MLTAFLIFLFYAARAAQADLGWDGLDRFVATIIRPGWQGGPPWPHTVPHCPGRGCPAPMKARSLTGLLLKNHSILVKDCSRKKGFEGREFIRIAVRDATDNDALVRAMHEICSMHSN